MKRVNLIRAVYKGNFKIRMGKFKIDAIDLHWIDGTQDDPSDYCLHGHAIAYIGDQKLECDATLSATALYLLKTLTEDHVIYEDNQMLPCCGFIYIPNENLDNVEIMGCANGIDWTVRHDGDCVVLELDDGTTERVLLDAYREEVFRFADKIEDYYQACTPKEFSEEEEPAREGYVAFWNEWHRRRGERKK